MVRAGNGGQRPWQAEPAHTGRPAGKQGVSLPDFWRRLHLTDGGRQRGGQRNRRARKKERVRKRQGKGQRSNPGKGRRLVTHRAFRNSRAVLGCSALHLSGVGLCDNRPRLASRYEQTVFSAGPGAKSNRTQLLKTHSEPSTKTPFSAIFISPSATSGEDGRSGWRGAEVTQLVSGRAGIRTQDSLLLGAKCPLPVSATPWTQTGQAWLWEKGQGKACTLRWRRWLTYVFTKDRNFTRLFLIC